MFKSIGCSRFVYNWALNRCNERYEKGEKYSIKEIKKDFTQFKKNENYFKEMYLNSCFKGL